MMGLTNRAILVLSATTMSTATTTSAMTSLGAKVPNVIYNDTFGTMFRQTHLTDFLRKQSIRHCCSCGFGSESGSGNSRLRSQSSSSSKRNESKWPKKYHTSNQSNTKNSGKVQSKATNTTITTTVTKQEGNSNLPRVTFHDNDIHYDNRDNNLVNDKRSLVGKSSKSTFFDKQKDSSSFSFSKTSRQLLEANEIVERELWRAARDYYQADHYDYSLFGLNPDLDKAVAKHQRDTMLYNQDRHLKEEQAKLVAPNMKQSPIAIMTMNPTYQLLDKPLIIEYPAVVENLRLNNTGFSWEVKIPYQVSMATALHGAHLNTSYRYKLDNLHCHWGLNDNEGSEHSVDNRHYSAEIHFVHYNMEKYRSMSKAARHPDGLVVLSVFLDAKDNHRNHAELEKIVNQLKSVSLKGEHTIIKQAVRIENLLPTNKSYWSYQGSMTTPPFFESVTWFILKNPIKCNTNQIQKFRNLKSTIKDDAGGTINLIKSNHRKTQPLNGRTIVNYDENSV